MAFVKRYRPLKFSTVEELRKKIEGYFKNCENKKKPLTITGLALALDTSRETLLNYENDNPTLSEYFDTIKKAKLMCQNFAEEFLFSGRNVVGAIFNLKNNYGWQEKQEIEHSGEIKENVVVNKKLEKLVDDFYKFRKNKV
jgi:DNA-binding XRE family transcriptional regulator